MPAPRVPNVGMVASKWARRAASAGEEYRMGVESTQASWQAASTAAAGSYKQAVADAASKGRYEKGVGRVGDAKWKKGAVEKGPARFAQGVAVAEADYSSQFAPYLEVIGRTDLPPRGPAGAEGNYLRVAAIGKALRALRDRR
jgi:hypothetical protein